MADIPPRLQPDSVGTFDERKLVHEVWIEVGASGESLPSLLLAGPLGDEARRLLGPSARQVATISAANHFEAMTAYYRLMGWGEYTTVQPDDYAAYPSEWFDLQ
jgi:hypothetical protein